MQGRLTYFATTEDLLAPLMMIGGAYFVRFNNSFSYKK